MRGFVPNSIHMRNPLWAGLPDRRFFFMNCKGGTKFALTKCIRLFKLNKTFRLLLKEDDYENKSSVCGGVK